MIKNRKVKIVLCAVVVVLVILQGLIIGVAAAKGYYLIHEWIFYMINYVIIMSLLLFHCKNRYVRSAQWMIGLILLISNTTFFYYNGNVNVVISKLKDSQYEVILKEYKNVRNETIRLKRRGFLFGKKVATLRGSSVYKALEENTYKIEWSNEDTAIVTYQANGNGNLQQSIFNFRRSNYISYQYVAVGLRGKWFEQDNPRNYIMYKQNEIIYAKDGQLYYYRYDDTEQQGIFAMVMMGDEKRPSFTVLVNADSVFGENGLIMDGGTITIFPTTLNESKGKVYYKE